MPAPTDVSLVIASGPTWEECCTWVPPQSSRDHSPPISTTRTSSSYVSPNRASAPIRRASGSEV